MTRLVIYLAGVLAAGVNAYRGARTEGVEPPPKDSLLDPPWLRGDDGAFIEDTYFELGMDR